MGFENSNLNDFLIQQGYGNPMSPSIANLGDNSPKSLRLSHNGGGISSVYLYQGVPAAAANKWFRVEFSTMYTHDNQKNDKNCHQSIMWPGGAQGVVSRPKVTRQHPALFAFSSVRNMC